MSSVGLAAGQTLLTLAKIFVPVMAAPDGGVTVGGAKVIAADMAATNGVVHSVHVALIGRIVATLYSSTSRHRLEV